MRSILFIFFVFSVFKPSFSLDISLVDRQIENLPAIDPDGPDFSRPVSAEDLAKGFKKTSMGAYLDSWLPSTADPKERLEKASEIAVSTIANNPMCKTQCKPEFKDRFLKERRSLEKRVFNIFRNVVDNEIRNGKDYEIFFHGFSNDFRLYQDVLRILRSFEMMRPLNTTFPFRNFAFDVDIDLASFLKQWWAEYLKHVKEKGVGPFPSEDYESPAKSVGLTFFPDSINYARDHLLSTNVNLLSNNLSLMNNSMYFFLNSTSATGKDVIVDTLIQKALEPYLKNDDGSFDAKRFESVLNRLKKAFSKGMASSGGQLAQIFVKKDVASEISYIAWNGGEPMWLSNKTGQVLTAEKNGRPSAEPINMFFLPDEYKGDYRLFSVGEYMRDFINRPVQLFERFPKVQYHLPLLANDLLDTTNVDNRVRAFIAQDIGQARILPKTKYFTDQKITGVIMFTSNDVGDIEDTYKTEIYDVIHDVMADFLAKANTDADFKPGDYALKHFARPTE